MRAVTSASSTLRRSRLGGADIDKETEEELLFLTDISRPVTHQEPVREDFDSFRLELSKTLFCVCNFDETRGWGFLKPLQALFFKYEKKMPQVIFFYKMLYILVYLAPTRALEPHEVREEIYKRECRRLNVIPLRSYLRNPIKNTLAVPYCGLGPRGAMALAAPLMVLFKNLALQNTGMNKRSRSCSEIISLIKVKLFISFRHIKTVLK